MLALVGSFGWFLSVLFGYLIRDLFKEFVKLDWIDQVFDHAALIKESLYVVLIHLTTRLIRTFRRRRFAARCWLLLHLLRLGCSNDLTLNKALAFVRVSSFY